MSVPERVITSFRTEVSIVRTRVTFVRCKPASWRWTAVVRLARALRYAMDDTRRMAMNESRAKATTSLD